MSEQEIRATLQRVYAELEQAADDAPEPGLRKAVIPIVLGAGLAVGSCSDDDESGPPDQDAGTQTGSSTTIDGGGGSGTGTTSTTGTGGYGGHTATPYMAPDP